VLFVILQKLYITVAQIFYKLNKPKNHKNGRETAFLNCRN